MILLALVADYVPFVYSLQAIWPSVSDYWLLLLLPLVVAISVVYKGTRVGSLRELPKAATWMTVQIFIAMIVGGVALWGITALATRFLYT